MAKKSNTNKKDKKDRKGATTVHPKYLLFLLIPIWMVYQSSILHNQIYVVADINNHHDAIPTQNLRLAITMFVDRPEHMYGVYSVRQQMRKFNMSQAIEMAIIVPDDFATSNAPLWTALNEWMADPPYGNNGTKEDAGASINHKLNHNRNRTGTIYQVDKTVIQKHVKRKNSGLWPQVFNKLWLFNLTQYDKLIVLDGDILVRTNIEHWFGYPTPCATQQQGMLEYNSGAMVIEPSTETFNEMLELLPNVTSFEESEKIANWTGDNWNSGFGQQGFLTAFFSTSHDPRKRMKAMSVESSVLISTLRGRLAGQGYLLKHRPHVFETVHFTVNKPYRHTGVAAIEFECHLLKEWVESVRGIGERFPIGAGYDFFNGCARFPATKDFKLD